MLRKIKQKIRFKKTLDRWDVFTSEKRAVAFLSQRAIELALKKNKNSAVLFGEEEDPNFKSIKNRLISKQVDVYCFNINNLKIQPIINDSNDVACLICTYFDSKNITKVAQYVLDHKDLENIDFEYVPVQNKDYDILIKHDYVNYNSRSFISPLLIDKNEIFEIYEKSLQKFRKKCQIRDFMDLSQLIESVVENGVDGDIAEFGSFEGHSGYLITTLLKKLGADKKLYMFDMFDEFPREEHGIDKFWNSTHAVSYDDVLKKFKNIDNVSLIKGDFTKTFECTSIRKLALAYIDCDSFRATSYIIEKIYPSVLSKGGIMIFEDYGHHPLLGNRIAVHKYFDKINGCIKFFSQFSGFYIVIKL